MKTFIPNFDESQHFQKYLTELDSIEKNGTDHIEVIPMKHTERESTVLMHSQERNVHGKIFGGYLMRQAFEMGWLTAALFQKQQTQLLRVDQVLFLKPVDVGSIVKFKSKVTYSEKKGDKVLMRVVT